MCIYLYGSKRVEKGWCCMAFMINGILMENGRVVKEGWAYIPENAYMFEKPVNDFG